MWKNYEVNGLQIKVHDNGTIETYERTIIRWNGYQEIEQFVPAKVLKPAKNGKAGYFQVKIYNQGKAKTMYVHRLVWIAFNGEIPDGFEIDHLDEDKANNNLLNLCLMTRKQNMKKMFASNPHLKYNLKQNQKAP